MSISRQAWRVTATALVLALVGCAPGERAADVAEEAPAAEAAVAEEDAVALFGALRGLVGGVQESMDAPASTIGINNGRESGQEVPHVHIHVIPRSRGDRGGIIQGIVRGHRRPGVEELERIAGRIRELASDTVR